MSDDYASPCDGIGSAAPGFDEWEPIPDSLHAAVV
jgi:hypothetical protein